ncbi:MAG: hypothetical protein AABY15_04170 [Nanoarchaeota archaeon]
MNIRKIIKEEIERILKPNISDIIREKAQEYIEGGTCNASEINNGLCIEFSEDIINDMGGYSDNLFELHTDMFFDDNSEQSEFWDGEKIKTDYGVWSLQMLNQHGLPNGVDLKNVTHLPHHAWIYYSGKHYDAESPDGVDNWTELPIFKRYFNKFR